MAIQGATTPGQTRAREAARRLMEDPESVVGYEPTGALECHAAVDELAAAFSAAGRTLREIVDNSRGGAESLSSDSLQGLSEIVQNADDEGATRVTFTLRSGILEVQHNGRPVNLRDLRAMSVPWLTTKTNDVAAKGRFGVGLSTLHAVAETFEVHSGNYHVRIADPFLTNLEQDPRDAGHYDDTLLRVVFRERAVSEDDFLAWCDQWDDAALLFLTSVKEVSFATSTSDRMLRVETESETRIPWTHPASTSTVPVDVSIVRAQGGRRWLLATCEIESPPGVARARKKTGETSPLGIALPLGKGAARDGHVYAGLPVVSLPGVPALVNAQFDPVTARQDLLRTAWNYRLADRVADLWHAVVTYLFEFKPKKAWRCIPVSAGDDVPDDAGQDLVTYLQTSIQHVSNTLASTLGVSLEGRTIPLTRLAVECPELTGLLTDEELTQIANADGRLPESARDRRGEWRGVLRHWRDHVLELPREVTVDDALVLLDYPQGPTTHVIRLTALALDLGLGAELDDLNCILDDQGHAHRPPATASPRVFTASSRGLASDLGFAVTLHAAYLDDAPPATAVRAWLQSRRRLIDTDDDLAYLERLAVSGAADKAIETPLTDEQLRRLRVAFEPLEASQLHRLGQAVGRAIFVSGYEYLSTGEPNARPVRPCDAYMPKRIETYKDGFFTAAGATPGLVWVANSYLELLKSDLPRGAGLGSQKFLRALGVATAPRVVKHPDLQLKYRSSHRRGLPASHWTGVPDWRRALRDIDADYTLEDWDSPDLMRVLQSIAADKNARRRRERANAVIMTLGRAWRDLGDQIDVEAAWAMNQWNVRGQLRAFWLWKAGSLPWLDNAEGKPTAPARLRRRSTANLAVFGDTPETFLHKDVTLGRPDVLNYLGVSGEPSTSDLIQRLRVLRDEPTETIYAECATAYVALASRVSDGSIGRTPKQLRDQLAERGGLIRTQTKWAPPSGLLRGLPVFGQRRDFVPNVPGAEPLWRFLQVPEPRVDDCLAVLGEIAKSSRNMGDDEVAVIETLRVLDRLLAARRTDAVTRHSQISQRIKNRLGSLQLWTSQGWVRKRPIYVVQDPQLAEGIGTTLPLWAPGADPAQFHRLFRLLKLTEIRSDDAAIGSADTAYLDDEATDRFQRALEHFKDDVARNDPEAERSLTVPWNLLQRMEVRIHPVLEATISPPGRPPVTVSLRAKFDPTSETLFLRDESEVDRVDGVGRALAGLFEGDERSVAYTWLAAVQKEREGQRAQALELASERSARETQDAQDQMDRLRELQIQAKESAGKGAAKRATKAPKGGGGAATAPPPSSASPTPTPRKPRTLVNIDSLVITDAGGTVVNEVGPQSSGQATGKPKSGADSTPTAPGDKPSPARKVAEPDRTKNPPKGSTTYRAYTDEEKERLGLRVASRVLAGDADALIDIRNQRNVGADAIDALGKFYELKVFANDEGDTITLEPSQIARAMVEPQFFLVVVSHLEGSQARPQVRVIVDPLRQLSMAKESKVKFTGIQEARGLVFNLDNLESDETAEA